MDVRSGTVQRVVASQRSRHASWRIGLLALTLAGILIRPDHALAIFGLFESTEQQPSQSHSAEVPPEYKGKQLPAGWLNDRKVVDAGKAIYEGKTNPDVNCADCHGLEGKPTRKGKGAMDLTDPTVAKDSDGAWFWRITEGVPRSKMRSWKTHLTEDQRWQVIAYLRTFAQAR